MKTTIALIIKFIVTMAAAWVGFMLFGTVALWTVVIIAAAGTVLNYLIGDLLILPRWGNVIASILDGVLCGATAWAILAVTPVTYTYTTSVFIFAAIVAAAEFFFHMYLISAHIIEKKKSDSSQFKRSSFTYNMEAGNELYPYTDRDHYSNSGIDNRGTLNSGYNKSTNQYVNGNFNSNKNHY